jgi:hypothetical protein
MYAFTALPPVLKKGSMGKTIACSMHVERAALKK